MTAVSAVPRGHMKCDSVCVKTILVSADLDCKTTASSPTRQAMSLKQGLVDEGGGTSSAAYVPAYVPVAAVAVAAESDSIYGGASTQDVQMKPMSGPAAASLLTDASAAPMSSASPSPFGQVNGQVRSCNCVQDSMLAMYVQSFFLTPWHVA